MEFHINETMLNFSNKKIDYLIPSKSISNITDFDISYNNFEYIKSSFFANMPHLERLYLLSNQFAIKILEPFCKTNITEIFISRLPQSLCEATQLLSDIPIVHIMDKPLSCHRCIFWNFIHTILLSEVCLYETVKCNRTLTLECNRYCSISNKSNYILANFYQLFIIIFFFLIIELDLKE